jgi:flagellar hook-basal body complex protein FliE
LGITLTAADTVIMFDSDWNLQNDIQAQDRCHRIGQTKPVMVYRLLTRRTYEMEMFHKACLKLTLDKIVMTSITSNEHDPNVSSGASKKKDSRIPFDKKEVEEMLKNGAYSILQKDEDAEKAIKQFQEEDINVILGRSEKIRYAPGKKVDHNSFSKATFVPTGSGIVSHRCPFCVLHL